MEVFGLLLGFFVFGYVFFKVCEMAATSDPKDKRRC